MEDQILINHAFSRTFTTIFLIALVQWKIPKYNGATLKLIQMELVFGENGEIVVQNVLLNNSNELKIID